MKAQIKDRKANKISNKNMGESVVMLSLVPVCCESKEFSGVREKYIQTVEKHILFLEGGVYFW